MASLSNSLSIAVQSLGAASAGLQVTNNNIANANTAGYTREVPIFEEVSPNTEGNVSMGSGVQFTGYQSIRDELLQSQIQQETTAQGGANAQLTSMQQIQTTFTTSSQDIGTEMSALFSSLSSLSTNSTSGSSARQGVITAGQNLANSFNSASSALTKQQTGMNTEVTQDVDQINNLASQIAALNPQLASANASGQDAGALQDKVDQLVLKLSALTNVSAIATKEGESVTVGNGSALVVGSQSYPLTTSVDSNGKQQVFDSGGANVTTALTSATGGDLGGTLETRDVTIPGLQSQLDTLAYKFAGAMNSAQATGYDQNGTAGQAFYTIPASTPSSGAGYAATMKMGFSDSKLIAASSDGTTGSTGNLANLSAVQNSAIASGQTPGQAYANLVYQVGSITSNSNSESSATTTNLKQLNSQRNSISGVSIDEESANLLKYQQAYQAAARVISTVQALFSVTMSMGTAGAA